MTDIVIVKVKPGSRKGPLVDIGSNGELTIYVREPAVDGKANDAVARLLATHLQLPRSRVELVSGATWRQKRFRVTAEPTGNPTAAIARVVVGVLAKSVGRWTITKHFTGSSSGPVGGVGQLGGRHATQTRQG
jgi:uncharacterized protein